jgi:Angiotensin-converting enzyme
VTLTVPKKQENCFRKSKTKQTVAPPGADFVYKQLICSDTLSLGSSEPWQTAMKKLAGTSQMDAAPLLEFFQPLRTWLQAENKRNGVKAGWKKGIVHGTLVNSCFFSRSQ